jgi:rSAM/selenodomain-associated transferase 1
MILPVPAADRRLLLFTKPARAGRVKTRLIGDLTAEEAAALHAAFLEDLVARLAPEPFGLTFAWALEPGEPLPAPPIAGLAGVRQEGEELGARLHAALAAAAAEAPYVAALGSDHPTLPAALVERAFGLLAAGAAVVLGPAEDGGYYLVALAAARFPGGIPRRLFAGIDWSTERVLEQTLARCRELGVEPELLPMAADVDTPQDLRHLALRMADADLGCPRTRALLAAWGRLPAAAAAGRGGASS